VEPFIAEVVKDGSKNILILLTVVKEHGGPEIHSFIQQMVNATYARGVILCFWHKWDIHFPFSIREKKKCFVQNYIPQTWENIKEDPIPLTSNSLLF
jgi:hypothetical protein